MKIVLEGYEAKKAEICFLGSISDILSYFKCYKSEAHILGISSGLQFRFGYRTGHTWLKQCNDDDIWIDCIDPFIDWNEISKACDCFGFSMEKKEDLLQEEFIELIVSVLKDGIPVLMTVDSYYLDYYKASIKTHNAHTVVIYGMDKENKKVWIADNYIPTISKDVFGGEITFNSFLKSLDLNLTDAGHSAVAWYLYHSGKKDYSDSQINTVAKINESGLNMLKSDVSIPYCNGIYGINSFLNKLIEIRESDQDISSFSFLLRRIYPMIVGLGGPASTRHLYSLFLEENKQKVKVPFELIEQFESISKEWHIIAVLIMKAVLSNECKAINQIIKRFPDLVKVESEVAEKLCCIKG